MGGRKAFAFRAGGSYSRDMIHEERPTFLIVDDNAPFRLLLRSFLVKANYRVWEAENGEQALEMLGQRPIDVVLLDLQMQPMGGFDFMPIYQQRGYKMPVLLITADPSTDILERATKLDFAGILKKPVTEERILHLVKRFV